VTNQRIVNLYKKAVQGHLPIGVGLAGDLVETKALQNGKGPLGFELKLTDCIREG
jgi:hypothetical protein